MAAENDHQNNLKLDRRGTKCSVFIRQEKPNASQPVIFNPDFFVERLRHEHPQVFTELVLSNITRLIDLPGDEFAQLTGESEPRVPPASGFLRSFNFLKRKDKGVVFGAPLTEEGIAQIYQLIEYLSKKLTRLDDKWNKTNVPDKERQIEAFQLLFMLLPPANRSLLKLLLDLLYHTARNQHVNKMSAINLATMFAPHIIWPKNVLASDLQGDIEKLNNGVAFLIRHSQKLFKAPAYIKDYTRSYFTGSKALQSKDDLTLCSKEGLMCAIPAASPSPSVRTLGGEVCSSCTVRSSETQSYTESALKELYQQVSSMPESAKKKKLIRQFEKQHLQTPSAESRSPFSRKHWRSRSLGGIIKRKVLGSQVLTEKENSRVQSPLPSSSSDGKGRENIACGGLVQD
ncbi:rho GTPase-activating protein 19-like isoform 2-T2 [Acanthopagrus schlegelii]